MVNGVFEAQVVGVIKKFTFIRSRSFAFIFISLVSSVFSYLSIPIIAAIFSPADVASYNYFLIATNFLALMTVFGGDTALTKYFYTTSEKYNFYISSLLFHLTNLFIIGILYTIILTIIHFEKTQWLDSSPGILLLYLVVFTLQRFIITWSRCALELLNFAILVIGQKLIFLALLILSNGYNTIQLELILFLSIALTAVPLVVINFPRKHNLNIAEIKTQIKHYYSFGFGLILSSIITLLMMHIDKIILPFFFTMEEIGKYLIIMSFASVISVLSGSINSILSPKLQELLNQKKTQVFRNLFLYISVTILVISAIVSLLSNILFLILPKMYHDLIYLFPVFCFSFIFGCLNEFPNARIYYENKLVILFTANLVAVILNLATFFLLLPSHGIASAAYGLFIGGISGFTARVLGITYFYTPSVVVDRSEKEI